MKFIKNISFTILLLMSYGIHSQCLTTAEPYLYAAPSEMVTAGNDGESYDSPIELQDALDIIQPGYTLWLLGGTYNGRYHTKFTSNAATITCPITVSSYPGEWAVLNGNSDCTTGEVVVNDSDNCANILTVNKPHITFQNFEITYIGDPVTIRDVEHPEFDGCSGITHLAGVNCRFLNLVIHDLPGQGIGTWKHTGATEFYGCMVYNNGWYDTYPINNLGQPTRDNHGPAFYVQNITNGIRLLQNNIVFNNFTRGFQLYSTCTNDCIQNITISENSIFNNGHPFNNGRHQIYAAHSHNNNAPQNITIDGNQIYNNHDLSNPNGVGGAIVLNKEYSSTAMQNILVTNNFMIGKNQTLVIGNVESLTYTNNFLLTGFININGNSQYEPYPNWTFNHNTYYTKWPYSEFMRENGGNPRRSFASWQAAPFFQDLDSEKHLNHGTTMPVTNEFYTNIVQNREKPNVFKVAIFDGNAVNVDVDFLASGYDIPIDTPYTIIDVENYPNVMTSGTLGSNGIINFDLDGSDWIPPLGDYALGYNYATGEVDVPYSFEKTPSTFGVFLIEFDIDECVPNHVLQNITETGTEEYLASNSITTGGSSTYYNVNSGAIVNHKAGNLVHLKPDTHIKSGSIYHAEIEDCSLSNLRYIGEKENKSKLKSVNNMASDKSEVIKVYPNPTLGNILIQSSEAMTKWEIHNQLGIKLLLEQSNDTTYKNKKLNLSAYPKGIYFLKITLKSGELITKQVIKK